MAAQTWAEIVNLTLRDSGVAAAGQSPSPQMQTDCKLRLNMMLSSWRKKRWMVYHLIDVSCPCDGSVSYGVGPGQPLNTPRTDRVNSCFIRQTNPSTPTPVDFPLTDLVSRENYNQIALKTLAASPPDTFWFDAGYPVGQLYPWPLPNGNWELHIAVKAPLDSVVNLTDTVVLPDEYQDAIYSNLYMRLCSAFRLPPDAEIKQLARSSMRTVRAANTQVPTMSMPRSLVRGRSYNPYSDR